MEAKEGRWREEGNMWDERKDDEGKEGMKGYTGWELKENEWKGKEGIRRRETEEMKRVKVDYNMRMVDCGGRWQDVEGKNEIIVWKAKGSEGDEWKAENKLCKREKKRK